jgi:hypothetical protein
MTTALHLAGAMRHAIQALNLEIKELSRPRRGLNPGEIDHLNNKRSLKVQARQALSDYLTSNGLTIN